MFQIFARCRFRCPMKSSGSPPCPSICSISSSTKSTRLLLIHFIWIFCSIISLQSSTTWSRLTVNKSEYMWILLMPKPLELPHLFHDQLRRAHPGGILVADMLDAVSASRRATAAGDNKSKWALDDAACGTSAGAAIRASGSADHPGCQ